MPDRGAATYGRPLCRCHGEPMDSCGPGNGWRCAVKRRGRVLAAYHTDPAPAIYARTRHALKARIEAKRQQIASLEEQLAEENTRGD